MKEILLCKYGEIVLKGANRRYFEDVLCRQLRNKAKPIGNFEIYRAQSTIYIEPLDELADMDAMFDAAMKVFGIIAIARAAVADPPVMILDEATSSIDTRTEAIVQRGMDKLMEGRTVFVIAHRLSTVMNSDVIMVLDHGHIIERGSHDKLISEKGTYYQLYTGAFELE